MKLWRTAWRNLWRNRRRTLVTMAAMSLALFVTIVYAGMIDGYLAAAERDALDLEIGSAQIAAVGYRDTPSLFDRLDDADALVAQLTAAGLPATARLLGAGLVAAGEASAGVTFTGVEVAADARALRVHEQVAEGAWLDEGVPNGVVLGRRLARTLGVGVGAELVVLGQAADGSTANDLFRVRGILRTVGEATDRAGVFMTAASFRSLFVVPVGAHQIIIHRPPTVPFAAFTAMLTRFAPQREVRTWRELMPTLATMMDSMRGVMGFMYFIIYVVIAIVILNAMLMAVFERVKELGVLKALGAGPATVLGLILAESVLQVLIAVAVGIAASLPVVWLLSVVGLDMGSLGGVSAVGIAMPSRWTAVVTLATYVQPIVMLVVIVGVAVLYPSVKAARIAPVEAMRHQ